MSVASLEPKSTSNLLRRQLQGHLRHGENAVMSDLIEAITIEGDEITASLLVWRRFRRPMPGLCEKIFDRNPGLATLGLHLPVGTVLELPVPAPREPQMLDPVRLW